MSKVNFKDYNHWCDFWTSAIPYSEPMEPQYLNAIKQEFPKRVNNNIMWIAHTQDNTILTYRVITFAPVSSSDKTINLLDLDTSTPISITWESFIDYEIEK